MFKESVEFVVQDVLSELSKDLVTGSAFSQARDKIKSEFFRDLGMMAASYAAGFALPRWKGYRVYGGDGSTLNLPPSEAVRAHFGIEANSKGKTDRSLARIFLIYDVLTGLTPSSGLGRMSTGESGMLDDCMKSIPYDPMDLIVLDRNFGHFYRVSKLMAENRQFCIRMSVSASGFATRAMADPRRDFITCWEPSKSERETSPGASPVTVRVTKTTLKSGVEELLVSSLTDMAAISLQDMVKLYSMRWAVEEGIKNLKPKMKIEHFGSKKPEGIHQEFHAHIFAMNMVALTGLATAGQVAEKTKHRKRKYKYNWNNAFRFVRDSIVTLFSTEKLENLLEKLAGLVGSSLTAIRPDRQYSRDGLDRNNPLSPSYK